MSTCGLWRCGGCLVRAVEQKQAKRAQSPLPPPCPPSLFEPEWQRVVRLHNTGKLDHDVYTRLRWDDADLKALPLDLQQARVAGPRAWLQALSGTGLDYEPPHSRPVGAYTVPEFRAAVKHYMKLHLSAEDHTWYNAGERIKMMKPEAQAAWKKGPSAWAAFLAAPSPRHNV